MDIVNILFQVIFTKCANLYHLNIVTSSVADPDPVGSGLFGHPDPDSGKYGSGSFIHKKTPCYSNFLVIKLSKIQFRPNNFFIFDFKWHRMFRFGKKMP